jgi:hypothetical protein
MGKREHHHDCGYPEGYFFERADQRTFNLVLNQRNKVTRPVHQLGHLRCKVAACRGSRRRLLCVCERGAERDRQSCASLFL